MSNMRIKNLQPSTSIADICKHSRKEAPFPFFVFHDLLDEDSFKQLRTDVDSNVRLSLKNNDLYKFRQSKDLRTQTSEKKLTPAIKSFIASMLKEIKPCLESASGLVLSDSKFDITASRYDQGNYLLCHNDDIKDPNGQQARSLAFIYYLTTKAWTEEDGGALILYDSDKCGEPIAINNRIYPKPNTLVVFRTSPTSWHSVQEVFCTDDSRLSINGWFHLANPPTNIPEPDRSIEPSPFEFLQPIPLDTRMEKFFEESVNPQYLLEKTCYMIRRKFKKYSEINLPDFLVGDKFKEISGALKDASRNMDNLTHVGPYNKRSYQRIKLDCLPQVCRDLFDALRSELFFVLLSRFTGLNLQRSDLVHEKQIQESSEEEEYNDDDDDDDSDESEDGDGQDDSDHLDNDDNDEQLNEAGEELIEAINQADNPSPPADKSDRTNDDKTEQEVGVKVDKTNDGPTTKKPTKRKRECDPLARLEFRHLEAGSYTLIHDYGFEMGERSALDVILHFNHDFEVKFERGGYLSYIDVSDESELNEADCELLSVEPKSNSLSLVYRSDESTCRFMKYMTKEHESSYQDLYCVYYERSDDLPHGSAAIKKLKPADLAKLDASD